MKNQKRSMVVVLGLAVLAMAFQGCGGDDTTRVVEEVVTIGNIQGVVKSQTAKALPLENATVEINPLGEVTTTNADGEFSFLDVEVGVYSLRIMADGFSNMTRNNVIVFGGTTTELVMTLLPVGVAPAKIIHEDESIQLLPADFGLTDKGTLFGWSSSRPEVAVVSDTGLVIAVRRGKTIISAIDNDTQEQVSLLIAVLLEELPFGSINEGDPPISAATGYIGSSTCQNCHPGKYEEWKKTLHNMKIRTPNMTGKAGLGIVADANENGVNDFIEGIDLGTSPYSTAFATFGDDAPKLSYSDDGKYLITIGPIAHEMKWTLGGNGYWKQRYFIVIGNSIYISPVQYNETTHEYVVYHPENWWDEFDAPLYQSAATLVNDVDKGDSWDRRCAACHSTGVDVEFDDDTGEWRAGYIHMNMGCEACHGPAGDHPEAALAGDEDLMIVNPANLSKERADDVCGSCHIRGASVGTMGGKTFGYPATVGEGGDFMTFRPGDDVLDLYNVTADASAYHGLDSTWRGAHGSDVAPYETFVASKSHHQQILDYWESPHSQGEHAGDMTCFSCHDLHLAEKWAIVEELVESDSPFGDCDNPQDDVVVQTENDDNSLCLACHANHGPFSTLCKDDINNDPDKVEDQVLAHMGKEVMMGTVPYDPENSGLGRCSGCHMPKMAKSAVWTIDADSKNRGDIHAHTFDIVWPSVNNLIDDSMHNSCSLCHSSFDPGDGTRAFTQWAKSGHADITQRHWRYSAGPDREDCVRCHSGFGFVDHLAGLPPEDQTTTPKLHSCYTCHDPLEGVPYNRRDADSATYPSGFMTMVGGDALLCQNCHQGRTWKGTVDEAVGETGDDFGASSLNPHYIPAGAMLNGAAAMGGYEYASMEYNEEHFHVALNCVNCHMSETPGADDVGGHTWNMHVDGQQNNSVCMNCHATIGDFEDFQIFNNDYDGDGQVEGIGHEVEELLDLLLAEIMARGVNSQSFYPSWNPGTGGPWDGPDGPALKKACYNWRFVKADPGAFVHNSRYAIQLLRDSYEDLTGLELPGDRP